MTESGSDTLLLANSLDLDAAVELVELLQQRRNMSVSLDASAVSNFGASCLQVLLAARSTWRREGGALHVVNPSEAFLKGLVQFGITPEEFLNSGLRA